MPSSPESRRTAVSSQEILQEADRCVKCGLCLPHCPTYLLRADEGESPRGRIALIQGWLAGQVPESPRLLGHLDRCLSCRACEAACPSGVRYGRLIVAARGVRRQHLPAPRRWVGGMMLGLIARLPYGPWPERLASLYRRSGLAALVRRLAPARLRRLDRLLPLRMNAARLASEYPAVVEPERRVALFTGCVGRLVDRGALEAAARLLPRLGVTVRVPDGQGCCGALHHHAGDLDEAARLGAVNRQQFGSIGAEALLGVASGCVAHLREHGGALPPVEEIGHFVAGLSWPDDLVLRPLPERVAVHLPCTMRHPLRDIDSPFRLLQRIPEIDLVALAENDRCCGAAGAYLLTQPEIADALRERKLAALRKSGAKILVTSNTGCALHLAAGIREAKLEVELLHPLELLARQLD